MLYRWRGHRYLSVREFDRALDDLTRGSRLDSTNYGIWYHLGIVRYARGDFAAAADAFARAQRRPPDAAELTGATDWLWMSLLAISGCAARIATARSRVPCQTADSMNAARGSLIYRNRRSSTSDMIKPNAGQPPERTERSNQARARAVSPRTRYQLPTP